MKKIMSKLLTGALLLSASLAVSANGYSNVYVFGDSLSDNGNLSALDPNAPTRFTNGPVAVEVVAGAFGVTLTPSNHLIGGVSGNNFAIAGAKAIDEDGDESTPDINLPTQVNAFLQINGGVAPADALYIVLIGGNDIRAAREIRAQGMLADSAQERFEARQAAAQSIRTAVLSQQAQIEKLIAAGAQNILVANAPDIGAIPETDLVAAQIGALAENNAEARRAARIPKVATKLSAKYNRILARKVGRVEHQSGLDIVEFDLFAFLTEQVDAAEDNGYTNTDDACIYIFSQGGVVNPECADFPVATGFLFWDEIHPTTVAHQNAAIEIIETILEQ